MDVVCRFFSRIIDYRRRYPVFLGLVMAVFCGYTQKSTAQIPWWKQNNLRVIQTNLPDYEAASLDADSLVRDLQDFSANVLLINAGGIMAFYPTKLDFQYRNPYMKPRSLGDIIRKCHEKGIHVIVRFDFSRIQESIFKAHPDWCYISPKGERIVNSDMYAVSINGPYVQDRAFKIMQEVMDDYPIDGIFFNMPGYQVNNSYAGKYEGIDQNEYDKKRFFAYSNGKTVPVREDKDDPLYQEYVRFKAATVEEWSKRLYDMVRAKSNEIAICTYSDKYVDIIRQESQNMLTLPYWPYMASDNLNNATHSYPHHIISNASIQQLSFQSRYNAIEPEEASIRLDENIANGSGLDISLMGDLRGYEDERNFDVIKKIYAFHKEHEAYFGRYRSVAEIAVIAPGPWPAGSSMQEYRGILAMLKEAHLPFDVIEDAQLAARADDLAKYRLLILPDITYLDSSGVAVLKRVTAAGTNLIATNTTLFDNPAALADLFGATIIKKDNDGSGNYLHPDDFKGADSVYLPILSKGRPGPPEIIGGHEPTGYYAMGMKRHGSAKAVLLPVNIGKEYYMRGYEQYKDMLLDVIDDVLADAGEWVQTNAPARVETILQEYGKNMFLDIGQKGSDGLILHLINLTGFSGVTYFKPLPVTDISFRIKCDFRPGNVFTLSDRQAVPFSWSDGMLEFHLPRLESYEAVVIDKPLPLPVIFDTDMGPDYDDVGAIALLHAYADRGQARILATMASNKYEGVAAVINLFNTYFHRPDIPIGVPKGAAVSERDNQHWTDSILARYPHAIQSNSEAYDAVALYRRILAGQPDHSVVIITVGFLTNLAGLLQSPPDSFSPLSGLELVKLKVLRLVSMAGKFPEGWEFNVFKDSTASRYVVAHWPTPVLYSGFEIGVKIKCGLPLVGDASIRNSPVKDVFRISLPQAAEDSIGRSSWDETAVLVGIGGYQPYYTVRHGQMIVAVNGSDRWEDSADGRQAHLVEARPAAEVQAVINSLIRHQPR